MLTIPIKCYLTSKDAEDKSLDNTYLISLDPKDVRSVCEIYGIVIMVTIDGKEGYPAHSLNEVVQVINSSLGAEKKNSCRCL